MGKAWLDRFARRSLRAAFAALALAGAPAALAQTYDCGGLQAKIADLDRASARPAGGSGPSRQQMAQLGQLIATARGLGCDRPEIAFGGGAGARCPGLNAQNLPAAGDRRRLAGGGERGRSRGGPRRSRRKVQRLLQKSARRAAPPARLLRAAFRHSRPLRGAAARARADRRSCRRRPMKSRRRMADRRRSACAPATAAISP